MFLRLCLIDNLVECLYIVSLVFIHQYCFLLYFSTIFLIWLWLLLIRWALILGLILFNFDLHWLIAVGAYRLFILEAVMREKLLMSLAHQILNLDEIFTSLPLYNLMVLPLGVLQVFNLARIAV